MRDSQNNQDVSLKLKIGNTQLLWIADQNIFTITKENGCGEGGSVSEERLEQYLKACLDDDF